MKNLLGLVILLSFTLICFGSKSANAQHIKMGATMIGGGLSFTSVENEHGENPTSFTLNAGFASFVVNNFAMGLEMEYSKAKIGSSTFTSIGFGPIARAYLSGGFFGQGQYIWRKYKMESFSSDSNETEDGFILSAGYTAFLNNAIALEPMLYYSFEDDGNVFGFRIGLQAFLGR